jgi:dienelactone hydrolase
VKIHLAALVLSLTLFAFATHAQNVPKTIPPTPTAKQELSPADRAELQAGVDKLGKEIDTLSQQLKDKPDLLALIPDIQIYHNAVRYPLVYHEVIDPKAARQALADADARLAQLRAGDVKWTSITGPRGYISRIDRSVQPYILVVPETYKPEDKTTKYRFDFWCHGRGEGLMELNFLRSKELSYKDHFVVNLYGRYCCANKFAGEIDLLEALDDVKKRYPVDENRLVNIGFSMGGASVWQFAVHYSDLFVAASPGAGFSEAREFLHIKPEEVAAMTPWQVALWHMYDCTDYAANIAMIPTIAYAGELDGQKQASDMMDKAMAEEGLTMERLIGPGTKHAYHKETRQKLDARLAELAAKGRNPIPDKIAFTTWTLRYNRMYWITVDGMAKEWERARVNAQINNQNAIDIKTSNVTALTLDFPAADSHFAPDAKIAVTLDGTKLEASTNNAKGLHAAFAKTGDAWKPVTGDPALAAQSLTKHHGLQGPIDDAFMDAFLIVKPTGQPANEKTGTWAASECDHAIAHWQKQFRGEAQTRKDTEVTEADIRDNNLILFGDPKSNAILAKIADKLPITWSDGKIIVGEKSFDAAHHMPALIFPNPLNPQRYIVLNSGFTFREFDYENNARQTPKLADYAIIDIDFPITNKAPGKIVDGGFFDEKWQLQK